MAAFWDLSTCRAGGLSVGPIPWHHIRDYAEFAGLDTENAFAFAAIIRRLDLTYLQYVESEQGKSAGGGASGGSGRRASSAPHIRRKR
jgi:hypothetical protein